MARKKGSKDYPLDLKLPDRGASSQIYCDPDLIGLETLGPVTNHKPEISVGHQEICQIYMEDHWPVEIIEICQSIHG